jgi:flagellar biosynthesis/type III secretory pathway protein FliH
VKVESNAMSYPGPDDNPDIAIYKQGYDKGFSAGRAEGVRECREAIMPVLNRMAIELDAALEGVIE